MGARFLCVGDMHLGRHPSALPEDLGGIDAAVFDPTAAWRAAVERALVEGVDAVLLAGDVVESLEDRFAAFAALEAGVRQLVEAGVPVLAVAGNHDVVALPRLADRIEGFRLLGRGGRWESVALENRAGLPIHLHGWSFPALRVRESPLAGERFVAGDRLAEGIHLGLLHCDLDQRGSSYAPVQRRELAATSFDAWLLGHVHRPDELGEMPRPIGYLGSLAPLDPGEPGAHGPWLLEVDSGAAGVRIRHLPLAALRFERIEVDLGSLDRMSAAGGAEGEAADELEDRLFQLLREEVGRRRAELAAELDTARLVGCRFFLKGRCDPHAAVAGIVRSGTWLGRDLSAGDTHFFIEKIVDEGQPAIDLELRAKGSDPPAILARNLLALQRGDEAGRRLVSQAQRALAAEARREVWAQLQASPGEESYETRPDGEEGTRARLIAAGTRALEELLAQVGNQA